MTGPTRGIGLSIATQLVRRGFSVLLVGRSNDKLTRIQNELRQLNENTQVEFVEIDFSTNSHSSLETLMTRVTSTMDVGVLVNNVGIALDDLSYFTEISPASLTNLCEVNMCSSLLMSRIILPIIVRRGSGGIINMSSMSGLYATPLLSPYSATKAFVHSLSISLSEEVAGLDDIDIMSVTPGFVATSMATSMFGEYARVRGERGAAGGGEDRHQHRNFSWCGWSECGPPVVSADECAESVLCQLGSGQRHTSGHWKHSLQQLIQSWIPSEVLSDVTHTCMRRFRQERRREEEDLDEEGSGWNGGSRGRSGHSGNRTDIVRLPSVVEVDEKEEEDEEAGLL